MLHIYVYFCIYKGVRVSLCMLAYNLRMGGAIVSKFSE